MQRDLGPSNLTALAYAGPGCPVAKIILYYNPNCPKCARQAKRTARLDWLGRVSFSTERSPLGEVPAGKIVVVDNRSDRIFTGIYATRIVCLQIPLFFPYGLLLYLSPIRRLAGKEEQGCDGDACEI